MFEKIQLRQFSGVSIVVAMLFAAATPIDSPGEGFGDFAVPAPQRPLKPSPTTPPKVKPEPTAEQPRALVVAPIADRTFLDTLRRGGKGPEMVVIPAGSFRMGSNNGFDDEKPSHRVTISRAFAMGKHEVTFDDYDRFCAATGRAKPRDRGWGRGRRPVIYVSWEDASAYVEWLSQQTGADYRLPTEAEWEYATRVRTTMDYWWGDRASHEYANHGKDQCCGGLAQGRDRWEHTVPVGSFPANPFGLNDTAGNVYEWVFDWKKGYPDDAVTDPVVRQGGSGRVVRGGSWGNPQRDLRSASRCDSSPGDSDGSLGIRLARTL